MSEPNTSHLNKVQIVYFRNLDILRFLAAFMIVIAHTYEGWKGWFGFPSFMCSNNSNAPSLLGKLLEQFIMNLGVGVDVFFLISGFLITYLLIKEKEETGTIHLINFYIRRTLRIWPIYFLIIAITPFLIKITQSPEPDYLSNILFIGNFSMIKSGVWSFPFAHFWSICIEEHFYLIWPFIVLYFPTKRLPVIFFFVIFLSVIYRGYISSIPSENQWMQLYLNSLCRFDVLAIGAFFGYVHYFKPIKFNPEPAIRFMLYVLFILIMCLDPIVLYDNLFLATFKKYFYSIFFVFSMGNYLFNPNALLNFKKKNFIHYLGKVSYGIYMFHNIIIPLVIQFIILRYHLSNFYLYTLITYAISIVIPIIIFELFEKQILKLKVRFEVIRTQR